MRQPRRACSDDGFVCRTWHRFWFWWWELDATFVARRSLILVVAIFTLFMSYGFWRDAQDDAAQARRDQAIAAVVMDNRANAERIEFEGKQRDFLACVDSNESRASIVAYITALAGPPESRSPGAQAALDQAVTQFAPKECPPEPEEPTRGGGQ